MWVYIILRKPTEALKIHCQSLSRGLRKPAMVTPKIQLDCSTVHDTTLWTNVFVRNYLGCGTDSVSIRFFTGLTNISNTQNQQINRILKLSWIWHINSINPQNNRDLYQVIFGTFGPNLVILAETGDELLRRQAQNGASFDFEVKFGLEGQSQSSPKIIGILTTLFYTQICWS